MQSLQGRFSPREEDTRFGRLVLHPLRHAPDLHFRFNPRSGLREPLTVRGGFHIALLHLQSPDAE